MRLGHRDARGSVPTHHLAKPELVTVASVRAKDSSGRTYLVDTGSPLLMDGIRQAGTSRAT